MEVRNMTEHKLALRPGTGAMLSFNLAQEISRIKDKPEWSTQDRVSVSLVKDDALNILLMLLKHGARLSEHHTRGPIALQVLAGSVRFSAGAEQTLVASGSIVALDREVAHSLESLEESAVLLTTAIL
jgi:quercetin dioxygenase-like cupin family protein